MHRTTRRRPITANGSRTASRFRAGSGDRNSLPGSPQIARFIAKELRIAYYSIFANLKPPSLGPLGVCHLTVKARAIEISGQIAKARLVAKKNPPSCKEGRDNMRASMAVFNQP
jgi:hypothetical protein